MNKIYWKKQKQIWEAMTARPWAFCSKAYDSRPSWVPLGLWPLAYEVGGCCHD